MIKAYLDIETIPGDVRPEPDSIKAPANYKDETKIRAYQEEHIEEAYRRQALDSMQGKLIALGLAVGEGEATVITGEESHILTVLHEIVGDSYNPIEWIGWNATSFDIPWLWRLSIKLQMPYVRNLFQRDKYRGNCTDLMLVWGEDYRDRRSMDSVAKYLGLAGKPEGMDGSMVYDLYLEGRMDEIIAYCKNDVETLREIYRKIMG